MSRIQHKYLKSIFWLLLITGCIEPYPPPIDDSEVDFLVVDASVDASDGYAEVILSRAVGLSEEKFALPELNALVRIESNDGSIYPLAEVNGGIYSQLNLPISSTNEYRIYIKTSDNNEYQSDFQQIKPTPPIDSIYWDPNQEPEGITIFVDTHDDSKNTRYYKWTFDETYEYEAPFFTYLKYFNNEVVNIPENEETFLCWKTLQSHKILVGTSDRLIQDVIRKFPLTFISKGSQRLLNKYSILVRQSAISRSAYDYWVSLQKTTESLGSLYDPQPGQVTSNIYNIKDPKAPVLGNFDLGTSQQARIFISKFELPENLRSFKYTGHCLKDTVFIRDLPDFDGSILIDPVYGQTSPDPIAYTYSRLSCTDCRTQGGVTTKPLFWK